MCGRQTDGMGRNHFPARGSCVPSSTSAARGLGFVGGRRCRWWKYQ